MQKLVYFMLCEANRCSYKSTNWKTTEILKPTKLGFFYKNQLNLTKLINPTPRLHLPPKNPTWWGFKDNNKHFPWQDFSPEIHRIKVNSQTLPWQLCQIPHVSQTRQKQPVRARGTRKTISRFGFGLKNQTKPTGIFNSVWLFFCNICKTIRSAVHMKLPPTSEVESYASKLKSQNMKIDTNIIIMCKSFTVD